MENITRRVVEDLPSRMPVTPGAYVIEHSKTGKIYIGSTNDVKQRRRGHLSTLANGINSNRGLQEAFDGDPELSFTFVLTGSRDEAYEYEQKLLNHYQGSEKLLNIAPDAKAAGLGLKRSEETRTKISEAQIGREPWNKGRPLDESHRQNVIRSREPLSKAVSVEGVVYPSLAEAGRSLGLSIGCVHKRVVSQTDRFKNYQFI